METKEMKGITLDIYQAMTFTMMKVQALIQD